MIFPHQMAQLHFGFYPYMLSSNPLQNPYQYFPVFHQDLILKTQSNIVQNQQGILKAQPQDLTVPLITSSTIQHSQFFQRQSFIKQSQRQENTILKLCNRNVLPNNVSLILCFIRRIKKSGKMVEKIIRNLAQGQEYTVKRFYSYQVYLKENFLDFKWKDGISMVINQRQADCAAFSISQQQFYNTVCRILIKTYLEQISLLEVLNHTKINKNHIRDHLKVKRYIEELLKGSKGTPINIQYV